MSTHLMVSLSGIRSATLDACIGMADELDRRGVPLSLLVVPRAPGADAVVDWVHARRAAGDAVLMHGYDHTADPVGPYRTHQVARLGRRAEFAMLPAHEAGLRLLAATRLMERLGLLTDAFAAPRWLASPGTHRALHRAGFAVCAEQPGVRTLRDGQLRRGRPLGFGRFAAANGEHTEPWWCRAVVLAAARAARRGGLVRIAVDARDLARDARRRAVLDAVDLARHHGAVPTTYSGPPAYALAA